MGYALALAARDRGATVTLISTTSQPPPYGVDSVSVETASEMRTAVFDALPDACVLLMAAAVADYRPATPAAQKIKKGEGDWVLSLARTPDILADVAQVRRSDQVIVGFAAETQDLLANARSKLQRKRLDLIVANDALQAMGAGSSQVTIIATDGSVEELPLQSKSQVAEHLLARIVRLLAEQE
jgi:phosphopantothenoylcysteine decarboxylase/phosphopantothenate--cysteine ligase